MNNQRGLLVVDVETTGFIPGKNACVEIGAVRLDQDLIIKTEFTSLVSPWSGAEIVPEAMRVNQISLEDLNAAPRIEDVIKAFDAQLGDDAKLLTICGWNVWFDVSFLRDAYARAGIKWPFGYRLIDVQSIFSFLNNFECLSQEKAISKLFDESQSHRALADAKHTAQILKWITQKNRQIIQC